MKVLSRVQTKIESRILPNESIYLRKVIKDDCDLLFRWANDFETRKYSFNKNKIDYEEHTRWFYNKLSNSEHFYILMRNKEELGQIRLDKIDNMYVINYSIDAIHRSKGYGKKIIYLLEEKLTLNREYNTLVAYVRIDNKKSVEIFEGLGYIKSIVENSYRFEKKMDNNKA